MNKQNSEMHFYLPLYVLSFMMMVIMGIFMITVNERKEGYEFINNSVTMARGMERKVITELIGFYNPRISEGQKRLIYDSIQLEANLTGLDPFLITGVIAAESSFRPNVISPSAAKGLMQVTKTVQRMMEVTDPFDIKQNIYAGVRYLQLLQRQFNQEELVLAAYNSGPTRVSRLKRVPRIKETLNYIQRVRAVKTGLRQKLIAVSSGYIATVKPWLTKLRLSETLSKMTPEKALFKEITAVGDFCETRRSLFVFQV